MFRELLDAAKSGPSYHPPFVRKIRIPDEEYKSKRDAYFEQKRKDRKNAKAALKARRKK